MNGLARFLYPPYTRFPDQAAPQIIFSVLQTACLALMLEHRQKWILAHD